MSSPPPATIDRELLYRETTGIINASSGHFIVLSLLFFLPLIFSTFVAFQAYFSFSSSLLHPIFSVNTLPTILTYTFFTIFLAVAGTAMVTYSAHQAHYNNPLSFSATVKSLSHSFIPLFSTTIAGLLILTFISLLFTLFAFAATEAVEALGFKSDDFPFHSLINNISKGAAALTVIFFLVKWGLAAPIAVVESKSWFEPLRQSDRKLNKFQAYSFVTAYGWLYLIGYQMMTNFTIVRDDDSNYFVILRTVAICLGSGLMFSHYVVANLNLYVQCKAIDGEEIIEKAVEGQVSGEYISLPVNEESEEIPPKTKAKANYFMYLLMTFWCVVLAVDIVWTIW